MNASDEAEAEVADCLYILNDFWRQTLEVPRL